MAARFTDEEIRLLIAERKILPPNWRSRIGLRDKRGHREAELALTGADGNAFRLVARQSRFNALNFSIILAICPGGSNLPFRLRRYNGKSHEHTNRIEGDSFYDFHVHTATERYQELGTREDAYAEPTDRFGDYDEALRRLVDDCGFEVSSGPQFSLFERSDE